MNTALRNILRFAFTLLLALGLCSAAQFTTAQQRGRNRAKPAAKSQAQEAERARRAKALTLLNETADAAREIDDLLYRARLQAQAAEALWPFDQQRARVTFRRAWEAATAYDKAEQEAEGQEMGMTADAVSPVTDTRNEILSKIAGRDPTLADNFLRDMMKEGQDENSSERSATERARSWYGPSNLGERRLALGYKMLDQGEVESAFKIAAPVTNEGASVLLIFFLMRLTEQDAIIGDTFYRLMIAQMSKDAIADANTALLLSTPIVSPELIIAIDEYGAPQLIPNRRDKSQAGSLSPISPATRSAFFNAAARVLLRSTSLRPNASAAQSEAARYFTISRLLPFYEHEAAQYAPELQARANALSNEFTESRRASLSSQLNLQTFGAPSSTDPLRSHVEELARTSDAAERARITIRIVQSATRNRFWDRALRAASELNDESVRRAANTFIAVNQIADLSRAYADEKEDDYESIVTFLKSVDVPPLAAAWGYAQAAQVAARKKDTQLVAELLTEATQYAARVDANTSQRVAAYGVVAQHAARLDQQRAWELLTEVVKATNALEDYAGDEASIEIKADENATTDTESPFTLTLEVFRLDSIFATMATLDFERAVSNARSLDGRVPRVFAQLAIAREILKPESGLRNQKPVEKRFSRSWLPLMILTSGS